MHFYFSQVFKKLIKFRCERDYFILYMKPHVMFKENFLSNKNLGSQEFELVWLVFSLLKINFEFLILNGLLRVSAIFCFDKFKNVFFFYFFLY